MGEHAGFFYGTLMVPGILYRVIYGSNQPEPWQQALTQIRPAVLQDYRRHKVRHVDYPAIIPCKGAMVRGTVCTGLTEGDIYRLDHFEGHEYDRVKVKAKILKAEVGLMGRVDEARLDDLVVEEIEVDAYVFTEEARNYLEKEEWDVDQFMQDKVKKWTGEEATEDGRPVDEYFEDAAQGTNNAKKHMLEAKAVNGTVDH